MRDEDKSLLKAEDKLELDANIAKYRRLNRSWLDIKNRIRRLKYKKSKRLKEREVLMDMFKNRLDYDPAYDNEIKDRDWYQMEWSLFLEGDPHMRAAGSRLTKLINEIDKLTAKGSELKEEMKDIKIRWAGRRADLDARQRGKLSRFLRKIHKKPKKNHTAERTPYNSVLEEATKREQPSVAEAIFRKEGKEWVCCYKGKRVTFERYTVGFEYIRVLLDHPGEGLKASYIELLSGKRAFDERHRDAAVQTLAAQKAVMEGSLVSGDETSDQVLTKKALKRIGKEKERLEEVLASSSHPMERLNAEEKLKKLEAFLKKDMNIHGRPRVHSVLDHSRIRVTQNISKAIKKIRAKDPILADHLNKRIHRGYTCQYDPDPANPASWIL